jgi:ferredoxin
MPEAISTKSLYSVQADASRCSGCMTCMLVCSRKEGKIFTLANARILIKKTVNCTNEFEISFLDECDCCGLCAKNCPYGALTRQKIRKEE